MEIIVSYTCSANFTEHRGGVHIKKIFEPDKKYLQIAIYVLAVILLSILCEKILTNATALLTILSNLYITVTKLVAPFIYGFAIAYLFNPIIIFLEERFFKKSSLLQHNSRVIRSLSILTTYLLVIGCIVWLLTFFVPEIKNSINNFIIALPQNMTSFEAWVQNTLASMSFIDADALVKYLEELMAPLMNLTTNKNISLMLQTVLNSTFTAASTTINAIMGVIISFYMLANKESFLQAIKKIIYAFSNERSADRFLQAASRVNALFKNFIVGKSIDSLIIGILCFMIMHYFLHIPSALLISVIVGVTNMIPYFGPFIGAVPSIFIVLLTIPSSAIWVALAILLLQQFDGIVLGPKILGVSTGMNPLWIIFSILIGGAVAGPLGMFLGVPICATVKLFFGEYIDKRYAEKYYHTTPLDRKED